jgi:outer membrane protein assembly factor BamB
MRRTLGTGLITIVVACTSAAAEGWPQWGGPARDFTVPARTLARAWGEAGPARLWSRPLGGGFAAIVGDGGRLYATFRDGDHEVVAALGAADGTPLWEYRYLAPVPKAEGLSTEYGRGPNATPLLVDGRLVTLGFMGHLHCLDAATGRPRWFRDLGETLGVKVPYFGHAVSPLAVGDKVVIVAGGLLAFDVATGQLVWENREFEASYGSPLLVRAGGREQVVAPVARHLAGFDAETGRTLWSEVHENQWGTILTSPVLDEAGRVFISTDEAGSLLVDPAAAAGGARPIWKTEATQISHTNAVRSGAWVYASVGDSASFLTATSLVDGTQAWKERGFARANLVRVGDDFLLLDHEGSLALVALSADGMRIVTRASIDDRPTWTPPTLIGTTLYVRDESRIQALDLSAPRAE